VIGQSKYKSGALAAPAKDVGAVAEALTKRGFTVTRAENLATVKDFDDTVKAFAKTVPTGGTALVYFSGNSAIAAIPQAMKPPRQEVALTSLDGANHPISAVLRPMVVPGYAPYGHGWQGPQSGSRINVLIVDAPSPTLPDDAPLPESLILFRLADDPALAANSPGLSPLAERFVAGLNSTKPLDAVLSGLSSRTVSSLAKGELARLASPASKAVSAPNKLVPGVRPGDEWVDANGIVFCWCPPGSYTIGSPSNEPDRQADELPAVVSFAEGFWLAKHELCYRETIPLGCTVYQSSGEHKLQPVNKAGGLNLGKLFETTNSTAPSGWKYGLPTEAEWEYAARADTKTAYSFGENPADLARHGNFADRTLRESSARSEVARAQGNSSPHKVYNGDLQTGLYSYAHPSWNDSAVTMTRVGSYQPNAWGLCDMHGNVAEMTSTVYDPLRLAVSPLLRAGWAKKPENEKYALGSVAKGGSWASTPGSCRSAFRGWTSVADNIIGTRLILRRQGSVLEPLATTSTPLVPNKFASTSGATARIAADGTVLVSGTAKTGDTYTVTCPVPAGIEPLAVKLELLTDPSLSKQGPGRRADGMLAIAEVSFAGVRGDAPATAIEVLDVRSDRPEAPNTNLVDGRTESVWSQPSDGKNHEAVFTIGLPSRTGGDGAQWRYPASSSKPLTSLVVTIAHPDGPDFGAATLGKFRLVVLHENPAAVKKEAAK
jgi:formylglycine-generating enzyme required for sulfatase activity